MAHILGINDIENVQRAHIENYLDEMVKDEDDYGASQDTTQCIYRALCGITVRNSVAIRTVASWIRNRSIVLDICIYTFFVLIICF